MSQTSIERLRDYLAQLPPQSQALLMREFERAVERGEDLAVANFVLGELRKIVRGGADKSYGIQVARLAGLPGPVIARAKEILGNLEAAELNADGKPKIAETPARLTRSRKKAEQGERPQLSLF